MKKVSTLKLREFRELKASEMGEILGGLVTSGYSICDKKGCLNSKGCPGNEICTTFEHCPSIPVYGKKRCF